MTFSS